MRGKRALGQICCHHGEVGWEMSSDMAQVTKGSEVNIKYLQIYKMSKTGKITKSSESFQTITFREKKHKDI